MENKLENSYRLGFFYYEPTDLRVFVPKKNKFLGWTLNFARPVSYIVIMLFFIIVSIVVK